jgi:hypothetical protein
MAMNAVEEKYNVYCMKCGCVFTPAVKSPLWWRAKQRADKGYLDALPISGEDCGCVERPSCPEAPFRVFGYDDSCVEFDVPRNTFVGAVRLYRRLRRAGGNVVFIDGVSNAVRQKIDWM